MEKGEEATKVFKFLVEMADTEMEDAYFLLSTTTTSRRLNRNLQLIEEEV